MTFTVTLQDLLIGAGIVVPLASGMMYWALRMAINAAVTQLELRIMTSYMKQSTCEKIREECERHREASKARARA